MDSSNNNSNKRVPILVAYDHSGSTAGSRFYHSTVQYNILSQLDTYDVLLWDHSSKKSSPKELEMINQNLKGSGGTSPIEVAKYCYENKITGHLILITDGQIPDYEVRDLDQYLINHPLLLSDLDCYLISSDNYSKLDATVIAPFLARFPHKVTLFKEGEANVVLTSNNSSYEEFIELLRSINTIEEFTSKYDDLFSGVISKMLGKVKDDLIRDELLQIQKRLLNQMKQLPEGFKPQVFNDVFSTHNISQMLQQCKSLNLKFYRKYPSPEWPAMIFHLLRMCSGNLNTVYSLSALSSRFNPDRVHKADVVKNFKITSVHITDNVQGPSFICPITYQEEHDLVILLKKPTTPLLSYDSSVTILTSNGMSPKTNILSNEMLDEIMGNPLCAIKYPEFINKLIECIDHPISLRSMKEAEELGSPITLSPLTRAPIIGGICLGPTDEHVSASNWAIAQLTADGKHLGHSDLWFALIWYLVYIGKIPYLTSILPQLTEHMKYRLFHSKASATLTVNPYNCLTEIPFASAVWFTLSLSSICEKEEQATEILTSHVSHFDILKKLLELTEYPLPDGVNEYLEKFEAKAEILRFIQNNNRDILNAIIASAFCYVKCEDKFIPIDGIPDELQVSDALCKLPHIFKAMSIEKRRAAAVLCQLKADDLDLNILDQHYEPINWCYGLKDFEIPEIKICPATARPYINVPPESKKWFELSEKNFGPLDEQLHLHFLYIACVRRTKKYPTKDNFLSFIYEEIVPLQKPTLPKLILQFIENVYVGYQNMWNENHLKIGQFIRLVHLTASRKRRLEYELKYENKHELNNPPEPKPSKERMKKRKFNRKKAHRHH